MNDSEAEKDLLAIAGQWSQAMIANDADKIGEHMADEWVIVSERGISPRETFLDVVRSGQLTHDRFEAVTEPRIKVYGDAAVLTARVVNTAYFGGQQFDADEWTSDMFVRRDGRWVCVLSHITSAIAEEEGE